MANRSCDHQDIVVLVLLLMVNVESHSHLQDGRYFHDSNPRNLQKREAFTKNIEDYLTRFGYLPQSDLETGALRTMQQLQDAIRSEHYILH